MKKLRILWLFPLLLLLFGCRQETEPLRFGLMGSIDAIPFALAQEMGLFEAHQVPVELIVFASARERDAAMQAGAIDGIIADVVSVFLYREGGFPLYATGTNQAGEFIWVAYDKGGDVAISSHTAAELALDLMSMDPVSKVEIPAIPVRMQMLESGLVPAAILPEPFAFMVAGTGISYVSSTRDVDFYPFITAFTESAIQNKKTYIQGFYSAHNEAAHHLNQYGLGPYLDAVSQKLGFSEGVLNEFPLPVFFPNSPPEAQQLNLARQWLLDKGLLPSKITAQDVVSPTSFW